MNSNEAMAIIFGVCIGMATTLVNEHTAYR